MEIEYSTEIKGKVFAYRFTTFEMEVIAKALKPEVKRLEKKIQKIRDDPNNEGQATYACRIDEIRGDIESINEIIEVFNGSSK
jgi:hypothetical protein